ncbi:MAG: hypothetical protein COT32_00740 [Candidatus Nealsonbacteria bacterium CG08_land_8_20_14_0_20_36_22]|nr:MAG: hypothetical protein COT32_00740 [Candidatus Nealsonbacteria bacterium CG08_land_8_20_14_0_20_36_22]
MGIFDKNKPIPVNKLRETIKKDSGIIPKTGGQKYSQSERQKIGREVFGSTSKYGSQISKDDYKKAIQGLQSTRKRASDFKTRMALDKEIRYLKDRGGVKP